MITIEEIKKFFTAHWNYVFLFISGAGALGVSTYYLFVNDQSESAVVYQEPRENRIQKNNNEKANQQKTINFDPIIDNDYWLIIDLIVCGFVYLLFKLTENSDKSIFLTPLIIILWKLGLVAFSSHYYQINHFKKNFERTFNPIHFFRQSSFKIFFSLAGYGAIAFLIYRDYQDVKAKRAALVNNFLMSFNFNRANWPYYINIFNTLQQQNLNLYVDGFREKITQGIQNGKISSEGIRNLISVGPLNLIFYVVWGPNYWQKNRYNQLTFLNGLFSFIIRYANSFDFINDVRSQNMLVFLKSLINDPSDNKIIQLKELINELFYFTSCFGNLYHYFFGEMVNPNKTDFQNKEEIIAYHLNFLRKLVAYSKTEPLFLLQEHEIFHRCQDIEKFHRFLTNPINRNNFNFQRDVFLNLFYSVNEQPTN